MPRSTPLVLAVVLLCAALTPTATAGKARPDLKITDGEISVTKDRASGSFTVRNKGTKRARATSTAIRVDGKRVRSIATKAIRPGRSRVVDFRVRVPNGVHVISVCADRRRQVRERREGNNCRRLGKVKVKSTSVPGDPIDFKKGVVFKVGKQPNEYWLHVPKTYNETHRTPIRLVVFMHGCGSTAKDQATFLKDYVDTASEFIVMAPGLGKDGQCWDPTADAGPLLRAVTDVKTHFNIDPKRVVLSGYSSGSTLAGQVAFANAKSFAGLLVLPGRPFWSNDNRDDLIAKADWEINIAWRPHTSDEYYPIADARADRRVLRDADYPLIFSEIAGSHVYTPDDLNFLFNKIGDWQAP